MDVDLDEQRAVHWHWQKAKGLTQVFSQLRGETAHDMLDARVLLEAVGAQVLAVAALLEAAVGHLRDERDVRIDPHAAEVESACAAQRRAARSLPGGS